MGFFDPSVMRDGGALGPHHNFVVIALMIMKFDFMYSTQWWQKLWRHYYYVIMTS